MLSPNLASNLEKAGEVMRYLITRRVKKLSKDFKSNKLEITIPENQMIEVAYKAPTGNDRKEQIVGAYIYLKMGEKVYPSIVEFSMDEVEIIGDTITRMELMQEASLKGKMFFINREICTCWEFIRWLKYLPADTFKTVNDNDSILRVVQGSKNSYMGKQEYVVVF